MIFRQERYIVFRQERSMIFRQERSMIFRQKRSMIFRQELSMISTEAGEVLYVNKKITEYLIFSPIQNTFGCSSALRENEKLSTIFN